jgi:hypothetical protein
MNQIDAERLIGAYRRVFLTADGSTVLDDLRDFSMIDQQAGSTLTHSECAYRNALQDFFRYIDALIADDT